MRQGEDRDPRNALEATRQELAELRRPTMKRDDQCWYLWTSGFGPFKPQWRAGFITWVSYSEGGSVVIGYHIRSGDRAVYRILCIYCGADGDA
jgi:hypothetical protein